MAQFSIEKIYISNIMAIEEGKIEVQRNKLLLFGPNGGGKSSLIYALLRLLYAISGNSKIPETVKAVDEANSMVRAGAEMGIIEVSANGKTYRLEIRATGAEEVVVVESDNTARRVDNTTPRVHRYHGPVGLKPVSVGYVDVCSSHVIMWKSYYSFDLCGHMEVRDAEVAEWIRDRLYLLGLDDLYLDRGKIGGRWIGTDRLSYGQRRAIGIIAATYGEPDVVAIETFEGGLHYDLAVDLLNTLNELSSFVVVESHVALAVKAALKLGWSVYYVDSGKFTRLNSIEELRSVAEREAKAYAAVA